MQPLPREYTAARRRVNAFARDVMALEKRTDCLSPQQFARRVDALLERSGWSGWRTQLRLDVAEGRPMRNRQRPGRRRAPDGRGVPRRRAPARHGVRDRVALADGPPVRTALTTRALRIVPSELGARAGAIGGAYRAIEHRLEPSSLDHELERRLTSGTPPQSWADAKDATART